MSWSADSICRYEYFYTITHQYQQESLCKTCLPYGPKNQEPWYKSRGFEETDFQEQSAFELQRQETEKLRQAVQVQTLVDEVRTDER